MTHENLNIVCFRFIKHFLTKARLETPKHEHSYGLPLEKSHRTKQGVSTHISSYDEQLRKKMLLRTLNTYF